MTLKSAWLLTQHHRRRKRCSLQLALVAHQPILYNVGQYLLSRSVFQICISIFLVGYPVLCPRNISPPNPFPAIPRYRSRLAQICARSLKAPPSMQTSHVRVFSTFSQFRACGSSQKGDCGWLFAQIDISSGPDQFTPLLLWSVVISTAVGLRSDY